MRINSSDMKNLNDRPIGIFDSGIGGLTVVSALHKRLPGEDVIYLGDTARVPYGIKSAETVNRYALECALFLLNKGVKLIVVACNTASAVALPHLRELLKAPMIGVVEPGVKAALHASINQRIGVIGTPSTIRSGAYQGRLRELASSAQVWGKACPLLVPLAEEGRLSGSIVETVLTEYLKPLVNRKIDTLILGCTHYPLFKGTISKLTDGAVKLVDSAEATAEAVEEALLREGLLRTHGPGKVDCYVTDIPAQFSRLAKLFFGASIGRVRKGIVGE